MRRIHHQHVHVSLYKRGGPLLYIHSWSQRRVYTESSICVFAGVGVQYDLINVFDGDETF